MLEPDGIECSDRVVVNLEQGGKVFFVGVANDHGDFREQDKGVGTRKGTTISHVLRARARGRYVS